MTLTAPDVDEIAALLDAVVDDQLAGSYKPRFNVAPSQPHPIVWLQGNRRELLNATFGLPAKGKRPRLINIKGENIKPGSYGERSCLIPVDGFYEWTGEKAARKPIWFHRPEGGLFFLAGILEAPAEGPPSFAVVTTKPNVLVGAVHDRMPAILPPVAWDTWLKGTAERGLEPAPEELLTATAVSSRVNSPANDDPGVLNPDQQ